MRYQVPPETLPGARPGLAVAAMAPLLSSLIVADLPALALGALNAWALGCRDRVRQVLVLGGAYVATVAVGAAALALRGAEMTLAAEIVRNVQLLAVLVALLYAYQRQHVVAAYGREAATGVNRGIGTVVALYLIDRFLVRPALGDNAVLRLLWGSL
ncbi:MAG: hypothetical protein AAF677_08400 [Pseudomonadota bacterium]